MSPIAKRRCEGVVLMLVRAVGVTFGIGVLYVSWEHLLPLAIVYLALWGGWHSLSALRDHW